MTQCVPCWELDESSDTPNLTFHAQPNNQPYPPHQPINLEYEVAELTWENGHLAMHGLALPRPGAAAAAAAAENPSKYGAWEKPHAGGTLESVVNQAAKSTAAAGDENFLPWFEHHHKDALVPCSHQTTSADEQNSAPAVPAAAAKLAASSAGSVPRKRRRGGRAPASPSSPENTSFTELAAGDHDTSSSRSRPSDLRGEGEMEKKKGRMKQSRSSIATKRSRAAAIHNQSERKRRDRINQRIMTLQKLVPNSSKTDKASMLDEVIEYLKQLQAQIQFMSKMSSVPQMMLPMTMQQMQLSVMAQMGVGMGMGMGMGMGIMDMNTMPWSGQSACVPPVAHPSAAMALLPMAATWDGSSDRLGSIGPAVIADPMAAFLACQAQPMSLEANYNWMAALYQHLQRGPPIGS